MGTALGTVPLYPPLTPDSSPVKCPNDCSGHGTCVTSRQSGSRVYNRKALRQGHYNDWDADRIQGCVCQDGWTGYDCSER